MAQNPQVPFHIMTKPTGALCNLGCEYCFYLEKSALYPEVKDFRMPDEVLEAYIKQYIQFHPGPVVTFAWQGGEPTLLGLDFFRRAVELQKQYLPKGWRGDNALQTNGTLLDEEWCTFLRENNFLVGLSLDGPPELHDRFRRDKGGGPTSSRVLKAMELMNEHRVEYNILCCVNSANAEHPLEVYEFFKENGARFLQFIPIVENLGDGTVSERTVSGDAYGSFLIEVFNRWVTEDLGSVFIQLFEGCVSVAAGLGASTCSFAPTCGRFLAMEHNGDLYACDHFVDPAYFLGNIMEVSMGELINLEKQRQFGLDKSAKLPQYCRECPVLPFCYGGCPKNRLATTPDGESGLNHLCQGYRRFFQYIQPFVQTIVYQLQQRKSPEQIRAKTQAVYQQIWGKVGRNDPCPCLSGQKYKKCCANR